MSGVLTLAYGGVSYVIFFLTFLYAIGFLASVVVLNSRDYTAADPWLAPVAIDLGLLSLFAIQRSVMARPGFKRLATRVIPDAIARSTYVLDSSRSLIRLFWQWRPLGGV